MLCELLLTYGHVVATAHDGPSALLLAEEFLPHVAVLDIGLPVMDGYELARRFSIHPSLQATRLVAVTGYGQDHDRHRSEAAGFAAHLVKPIDLERLREFVEHVAG
jgi:CheY-like chemotaxis protein